MSKKLPDFSDELDESSLDEYGVWVKAGPDEGDGFITDLIDDSLDDLPADFQETGLPLLPKGDKTLQDPEPGSLLGTGITLKGQEVADMSEQDKTMSASLTDNVDDQEITLDASEELALSNDDDDLGSLSELLLNIDEESDQDDTIYLEDDDLSFDLDEENEDLLLEQEAIDTQSGDDFGEDIVIPGLDDELNIDMESSGLKIPSDSLEGLDELDMELSALEDSSENSGTATDQTEKTLDSDEFEELSIDEFLDDQVEDIKTPDSVGSNLTDDLDLDDEISFDMDDSELNLDSEPLNDIELDEELSNNLSSNILDDSLEIDIGPELDLDEDLVDSEISFESGDDSEKIPGVEIEIDSILSGADNNDIDLPDLSDEAFSSNNSGFDDVAAVTSDITSASPREADSSSSKILSSIEDELHAIRSELTDLRSELKKLRTRDSLTTLDIDSGLSNIDSNQAAVDSDLMMKDEESKAIAAGGGFFDDDEDETIALTGDELDNILNTAEFTEEAGEPSSPDLDDETPESFENELSGVPVSAQEFTFSDSVESETSVPESKNNAFEDSVDKDDFSPIEEISLEEMDEESFDDLSDELLSTSMSSPDNAVPNGQEKENVFNGSENAMEQLAQLDIEKELADIEDLKDEEEDIELYTGGELDSLELEIPEDFSDTSSDDIEQLIESDSDIESLEETSEPALVPRQAQNHPDEGSKQTDEDISFNLKQEIKAVLAYMDQLLESLPEEKIEEFARSEHFDVYKKLFDELGL